MLPMSSHNPSAVSTSFSNSVATRSEYFQVNSDIQPDDLNIMGIQCDVSSELSVQKAFADVMDRFGRVDSVVASAGKYHGHEALVSTNRQSRYRGKLLGFRVCNLFSVPFFEGSNLAKPSYPFDRIKRLYDINVHGAFFTAREAARNMIPNGGGSIVLVASMSSSVLKFHSLALPYLKVAICRLSIFLRSVF
jgi:NAD(P)-dependent dehydrogenase (short-subunit alcohol dehydrogenase family)